MIMPRGSDQLLLPINPLFMWATLLVAFGLDMIPLGRLAWMPDFVALVLVFWNVQQPLRVGVGAGFVLGLMMDVHDGALLGQHALAYTLVSFASIAIHRRLLWFPVWLQALQLFPIFVGMHAVSLAVRMMAGGMFPGWNVGVAPVVEALLWPVANLLLLSPQRRAPDRDENRPL